MGCISSRVKRIFDPKNAFYHGNIDPKVDLVRKFTAKVAPQRPLRGPQWLPRDEFGYTPDAFLPREKCKFYTPDALLPREKRQLYTPDAILPRGK